MTDLIEKKPFNLLNVRALELDRSIPTRVELFWTNFFFFHSEDLFKLVTVSHSLSRWLFWQRERILMLKVDFHEFRLVLENKREIFA